MTEEIWIEWIEPFGPGNEPVYMRVLPSTAIAVMKGKHSYESDEEALKDFMVVHWAYKIGMEVRAKTCAS